MVWFSSKVNMWEKLVTVFSLTLAVHGQYYGDLDNLGARISARVAAQLAPLEGLGERINAQVQQSLRPMQVRDRRTAINLNSRLSELDGLGDKISQQVHDDLEPVRAIELNFKMRDGVGGVTIATHQPAGRQFIIKDYQIYTCDGRIDLNVGSCSGNLVLFKITPPKSKSDWCFISSYSLVNNHVCLGTGGISIEVYNNQVNCRSTDNNPSILMELDEYKRLCSSVRESTEYRYIPNVNDNNHVEIPNTNRYVKCENQQKNLCIFHEKNSILSTYSGPGYTSVHVQSRNGAPNNVILS